MTYNTIVNVTTQAAGYLFLACCGTIVANAIVDTYQVNAQRRRQRHIEALRFDAVELAVNETAEYWSQRAARAARPVPVT